MKCEANFGTMQLNHARLQIKNAIVDLVKSLYVSINGGNPDFSMDEEYVLAWQDITKRMLSVQVTAYDSYTEWETVEYRLVEEVRVTLDDNLYFILEGDDSEIEWRDIAIEGLGLICDFIIEARESEN